MNSVASVEIPRVDLDGIDTVAKSCVKRLPRPLVIGLVGTLGAGKTTLVQAISRAAGIDSADVTSPTFTLLQTYTGTLTLHHLDAYRVSDEDEFLELGVEELFEDEQAWTIVEWADRVRDVMPVETLWIEMRIAPADEDRVVKLYSSDPRLSDLIERITDDLASAKDAS